MSPDNSTFPSQYSVNRTSLSQIIIRSSYQSHDATVFPVHDPLPGSWFAAGYLANWDQRVQQEVFKTIKGLVTKSKIGYVINVYF